MNILELLKSLKGGLGGLQTAQPTGQTIPGFGGNVGIPGGAPGGLGMPAMPTQPQQQMQLPPTFMQKVTGGLARARDAITPIDPTIAATMSPEQQRQLRQQAIFRTGIGMLGASGKNDFGGSVAAGLGQGLGGFQKEVEGVYQRGQQAAEIKREEERQKELDRRYTEETGRQRERDSIEDKQWQETFKANQQYRKDSLASLERRTAARGGGVSLSEDAIDLAARRLFNGEKPRDVLANFGRGNQGARDIAAVQNRFAEIAKAEGLSPQAIAVATQELSADARTRLELGAREGKIAPRVMEAKKFADIALEASAKVDRGSFQPMTKILQMTDQQLSDPKLAAFKAANLSLINAYAAAVTSGVPTVHSTEEAEKMLYTAQSPEAYEAVVKQLRLELQAALDSPRAVMDEMRDHDLGPTKPPQGVVNWADLK